ncbi:DedA family protein [Agromyces subbeticus]|uniref:DedA family protein n=1 Tax=Agromyces subbeticus TaxID=293890 RepID=UPI0003B71EC8|nr:DedA family protein [Agromyces subbeticus]
MEFLTDIVLSLVQSPWVFVVIFVVCVIDGFFPPVPSETVVIAAAAAGAATGDWAMLVGAVIAASAGAFLGDNIAYTIGRTVGVDRWSWMRRDSARRAIAWAREGLDRRATVLILTARYIPVGRVAVNVTAGAAGLSRRRFLPLSALAALSWAVYSVAIGLFAGRWLSGNPLLAALLGIAIALVIGIIIDRVSSAVATRRAERRTTTEEPAAASVGVSPTGPAHAHRPTVDSAGMTVPPQS